MHIHIFQYQYLFRRLRPKKIQYCFQWVQHLQLDVFCWRVLPRNPILDRFDWFFCENVLINDDVIIFGRLVYIVSDDRKFLGLFFLYFFLFHVHNAYLFLLLKSKEKICIQWFRDYLINKNVMGREKNEERSCRCNSIWCVCVHVWAVCVILICAWSTNPFTHHAWSAHGIIVFKGDGTGMFLPTETWWNCWTPWTHYASKILEIVFTV